MGAALDWAGKEGMNSPSLPQYSSSVSYPDCCSREEDAKSLDSIQWTGP